MTVPYLYHPEADLIQIAWPQLFVPEPKHDSFSPDTPTRGTIYECSAAFSQDPPLPVIMNDVYDSCCCVAANDNGNDGPLSPVQSAEAMRPTDRSSNNPFAHKDAVSMEQVMSGDTGGPPPVFQSPRHPHDLYTPTWTRGTGAEREGRCAFCKPPVWLRLKQSAYWYHMNFVHGISAASGRPYGEPCKYRVVVVGGGGRGSSEIVKCEGWCEECRAWRPVGSSTRDVLADHVHIDFDGFFDLSSLEDELDFKAVFPHTNWYKHCQKQHKNN